MSLGYSSAWHLGSRVLGTTSIRELTITAAYTTIKSRIAELYVYSNIVLDITTVQCSTWMSRYSTAGQLGYPYSPSTQALHQLDA